MTGPQSPAVADTTLPVSVNASSAQRQDAAGDVQPPSVDQRSLEASEPSISGSGAPPAATPELRIERFTHSSDPAMTGMRGVIVSASTRFASGRVFSVNFPDVYVSDSGDVEMGDLVVPLDDAAGWFRAVADYLDGQR